MSKRCEAGRNVTVPRGYRAGGMSCGAKASGKPDLTVIASDRPATAAGVFTRNAVVGAPVTVTREHLKTARTFRAIVCNSGVSNVATGQQGIAAAPAMCAGGGAAMNCPAKQVLVASTGVIGQPLPMGKITPGIESLCPKLTRGSQADKDAARAILTTDLVPKWAKQPIGGKDAGQGTVAGIAKGSGMIAPNMATMLAFITTDAAVASGVLRQALREAVAQTFNRTSVDSDTSTSDMVLVLANGAAGAEPIERAEGKAYDAFCAALTEVCRSLAEQVVRDGEGATRLIRVEITGAATAKDADRVGRAIVDSPLVKTAVHGGDPNWGRLAMAVGKSGAKVDPATLGIGIGGVPVFEAGEPVKQTAVSAGKLARAMRARDVVITVAMGRGSAEATWLGCDLSREYITINADYTT